MTSCKTTFAKFKIGQVIRHRLYALRGMVFDVDAEFTDSELAREALLVEVRSPRSQPFYYVFAEIEDQSYIAYVSEQDLLPDASDEPLQHPHVATLFERDGPGSYRWSGIKLN